MVSSILPERVFDIDGRSRVLGVFGYPVEHSLSPSMHNAALAALGLHYVYIPFAVPPDEIGPAIRSLIPLAIIGVNLTVPHKERVLPFLDEITPEAAAIGAVNTVHNDGGRLIGYNTDGEGFAGPLAGRGFDLQGRRAVVLGAGGAARAVVHRLARDGARIVIVNRTSERAARLAREIESPGKGPAGWISADDESGLARELRGADLLVNTTSVGMYPGVDAMPPIPPDSLHPGLLVYDLVYNPLETALLSAARAAGAQTIGGAGMLVGQGAAAFRIWTGCEPPIDIMETVVVERLTAAEERRRTRDAS